MTRVSLRQGGFDALPQPVREDFAGWIFEARHLIQVVVVEHFMQWLPDVVDAAVVDEEA